MCCQHIAENIRKKFGRQYKAIFWQITRTADRSIFDSLIETLQRDSTQVIDYISSIGYTFLHFPVPRFGHDTSNIVESTNSMWRKIRELPPLQLLNGIYEWFLTTWYQRGQTQLLPGNSILSNIAYQGYKYRESIARSFRVLPSSDTHFLVSTSRASQHIVTLPPVAAHPADQYEGICSCGKYSDYHAPCSHTIACILYLGRDPFCYFDQRYRWETSQRIYKYPIPPITIQGLQVLDQGNLLRPPIKKAKRGRPKIARIRTNQDKTRVYNCSTCRQPGHNRRICPNQPVEHGRAQRIQDQLVEDSDSASFSDQSGCSNTTSDVIEVDQEQVDSQDQDQFSQFNDMFWAEQQQWIYDHEVRVLDQGAQLIQPQEVQDHEVQERRYPSKEATSYCKGYCPSYIRLRVVKLITTVLYSYSNATKINTRRQGYFQVLRLLEYHYRVPRAVALIP
jgi:hypothetical protein